MTSVNIPTPEERRQLILENRQAMNVEALVQCAHKLKTSSSDVVYCGGNDRQVAFVYAELYKRGYKVAIYPSEVAVRTD